MKDSSRKSLSESADSKVVESPVHITSGGRIYVDIEKQMRTPEVQRILREVHRILQKKKAEASAK